MAKKAATPSNECFSAQWFNAVSSRELSNDAALWIAALPSLVLLFSLCSHIKAEDAKKPLKSNALAFEMMSFLHRNMVDLALLCDRMDTDGSGALSLEEMLHGDLICIDEFDIIGKTVVPLMAPLTNNPYTPCIVGIYWNLLGISPFKWPLWHNWSPVGKQPSRPRGKFLNLIF